MYICRVLPLYLIEGERLILWNIIPACSIDDPLHGCNAVELVVKKVLGNGFFSHCSGSPSESTR
jgi:hypothetical protein